MVRINTGRRQGLSRKTDANFRVERVGLICIKHFGLLSGVLNYLFSLKKKFTSE